MCTFIDMDEQEIKRLFNHSSEVALCLKNNILNNESFLELLRKWKNPKSEKFIKILEDVCLKDLPDDVKKNFFLSEIVHNMMVYETEAPIRDILIDIAFMICKIVTVSEFASCEYEQLLENIYSKYIPAISQLRDADYENWHKLWMFLVRFCAVKIHESMDLTNRLLRIVEYAFRNSSQAQRLKGYDCWKELIDNASLNPSHMCTKKQIKLLVTPLKAKFSKQEMVICKRFDIFVYLLEKLERNALLCLSDFLEFCFGPINIGDAPRSGQAKSVPQIWSKSTNILLSILGHSHDHTDCIPKNNHFIEPLLNKDNFGNYYKIVIYSIGECCGLLKGDTLGSKREKVIKCMWKSLFKLIFPISEETSTYFVLIGKIWENYIQESKEILYYKNLLMLIFTTLMEFEQDLIHDCVPLILKQLLTIFLTMDNGFENINDYIKQVISHAFSKIVLEENKVKMINIALDCFATVEIEDAKLDDFTKIWLLLANELATYFPGEKLLQFSKCDEFFMWPSENLHHMESGNKKQTVLHWLKLYRTFSVDSETKKVDILKELERKFKNNPLITSNIISLLTVMSQFETKNSTEFVTKILEVVSVILQLPNLSSEDEQKLSSIIIQYFEPTLECYNAEKSAHIIKLICTCIEHILCIHSGFKFLDHFVTFFKISSISNQEKFSSILKDTMSRLYSEESDANSYNAKELTKCISLFTESTREKEEEKQSFILPTGRSARIACMGKNSPTSPNKPSKTLQLFGKDPDTMSPLKVKGSQLNKTPISKKKVANVVEVQSKKMRSVLEENSQDFVPVNSEVKLEMNKLNEHQKEVLKKRREDIPALYQDLSQSCSQDMFSSKSNSREPIVSTKDSNIVSLSKEIPAWSNLDSNIFSETHKEVIKTTYIINDPKGLNSNDLLDKKPEAAISCDLFSNDDGPKGDIIQMNGNKDEAIASKELFSDDSVSKGDKIQVEGEKTEIIDSCKVFSTNSNSKGDIFKTNETVSNESIVSNDAPKSVEETLQFLGFKEIKSLDNPPGIDNNEIFCDNLFNETQSEASKSLTSHLEEQDPIEKKRRSELKRLKMDIVGVEKFLDTPRRTREKKIKLISEKANKKNTNQKSTKVKEVETPEVIVKQTPTASEYKEDSNKLAKAKTPVQIAKGTKEADTEIPSAIKNRRRKRSKAEKNNEDSSSEHENLSKEKNITTIKEKDKINKSENNFVTSCVHVHGVDKEKVDSCDKINKKIDVEVHTPNSSGSNSSGTENSVGSSRRKRGRPKKDSTLSQKSRTAKILQNVDSRSKLKDGNVSNNKETPKKERHRKLHEKNVKVQTNLDEHKDNNAKRQKIIPEFGKDAKVSEDFPNSSNKTVSKEVDSLEIEANEYQADTSIALDIMEGNGKKTKGEKRKLTDDENEDIIESSQESFREVIPLLNSSKKKLMRVSIDKACITLKDKAEEKVEDLELMKSPQKLNFDDNIVDELASIQHFATYLSEKDEITNEEYRKDVNTTQDTTLTQENSQNSIQDEDTNIKNNDILTESPKVCLTESPMKSPEPPKKPKLTETDLIICHMDTMSVCGSKDNVTSICDTKHPEEKLETTMSFNSVEDILATSQNLETSPGTPVKSQNILSSPVTAETPSRTNELLDNTMDISPITSRRNSQEEVSGDVSAVKILNFLPEEQLPSICENSNEFKAIDHCEKIDTEQIEEGIEENDIANDVDDTFDEENSLDDFENVDASSEAEMTSTELNEQQYHMELDQEEPPIQNGQVSTTINISNGKKENALQDKNKIQSLVQGIPHKVFIKRKGGHMSSPSALRIKKLMNNIGQQQRFQEEAVENLNENDLLTFSREIPSPFAVPRSSILKRKFSDTSDGEGVSPCPKRKRVNFCDPCLTSKKLFIKDEYHPSIEAKRLFDITPEKKLSDDYLKDIFDFSDHSASTETDSDMPETEPSLTTVNPMILQKHKPIFPKLVDCKDDVLVIVKRITSPMFVATLMKKLDGKNVKTIGDLAKLSESEVNRFPFKVPVVANVIKALENYYKKKGYGENVHDASASCSKEQNKEFGGVVVPKLDIQLELKMVMQRAIQEKIPLEVFAKTICPHIDSKNLVQIVRTNYPNIAIDTLEEKDYKKVLNIIVQSKGISETLKMAEANFCDNRDVFQDGVVEYVRNYIRFGKLIKGRNISDLVVGIEENIENKVFQKCDVIRCFFPLLTGPKDILPYLDTLSIVQFDEIIINRLKGQNVQEFFERIIKEKPLEDIKKLHENLWLKQCFSTNEIINLFQKKIQSQSKESSRDVLVQMFEFCSDNLDSSTLLELHVGFLRRISSALPKTNRES
ncbi:telomere-associated protein RIF1-like [Diorhabda carinulata]|uniref:telomere-associated protein RIF1-like n=1 Tax=Diorhabda carinulata TaxID=1163345 RepID=UPI0025A1AEA2|nr:telomere-associated protein RIF1-like [Diorhabda carinulata]